MRSAFCRLVLPILLITLSPSYLTAAEPLAPPQPVTAARIQAADTEPGSWLTTGRTYNEQRFSPLAEINRDNISKLGLAWAFDADTLLGLEATPLVVDGVMYVSGSWSMVFALDAKTGRELWRFDPQVPRWKSRHACCDVVNRGVAFWEGKVYIGTIDARLVAVDAKSGEIVWETRTAPLEQAYTITGAPRVVKGKVIIGNGGADIGVRGFFSAFDANTGELVWRFYTVPGSKNGPHEHPEVAMAAKTWSKDSLWNTGLGGTVWDSFAYDPELDLLYAGVGNSTPYDRELRSPGGGDNLFLTSILAVRPDTGKLVWHYQTTPAESWDYTATQHMILADIELQGHQRSVLMQAPKNGFFYILDRATGELLSADPYVEVSWATHIDMKTGRPVERAEATWSKGKASVTPGTAGGHNWHPMSYNPQTGLVYIPTMSTAYVFYPEGERFEMKLGSWNAGEDIAQLSRDLQNIHDLVPICTPTHITAWNPQSGEMVWKVDHETAVPGGVLSTAGDLVFQGRGDSTLSAFDAKSGEPLWDANVGHGAMAAPISYEVDGEQYVAIAAGIGGSFGGHFTKLEKENKGFIYAFKLGGSAAGPVQKDIVHPAVIWPEPIATPEVVDRGLMLYGKHCMYCHGMGAASSGLRPDLRLAGTTAQNDWNAIVLGGLRIQKGMPGFSDHLSVADAEAIRSYVNARAWYSPGLREKLLKFVGEHVCLPVSLIAD